MADVGLAFPLDDLYDEVAAAHCKTGRMMASTDHVANKGVLGGVLSGLSGSGVSLLNILKFIEPIIQMILGGMSGGSIIQAILALLNISPPSPVPTPVPTPAPAK